AQFGRRAEGTATRRHQQFELAQHLSHHSRASVIPIQDPLGGISPAQKIKPGPGIIMFPALARNIDEKSSLAGGYGVRRPETGGLYQLNTLLQRGPGKIFVRKDARYHKENLIHVESGGVRQTQVGHGGWVETARKDRKFVWFFRGSPIVPHHCSV